MESPESVERVQWGVELEKVTLKMWLMGFPSLEISQYGYARQR